MSGLPPETMPLRGVVAGRHAVAVDGRWGARLLGQGRVEEAWFRGTHCDIAGGPGACGPLAGIALDWVFDGAVKAGVAVRDGSRYEAPSPGELDALAETARTISLRRLPADALVHASVEVYLRAHPEYWRRLPAQVVWTDTEWLARGERLVGVEQAAEPVDERELAAAAS